MAVSSLYLSCGCILEAQNLLPLAVSSWRGVCLGTNWISSLTQSSFRCYLHVALVAQLVQNPPAMQETPVRFLSQEDPLEKGKATHSSILGLPLWLSWQRLCLQCRRPGFDPWFGKIPWRRERLHTPVFWPGEICIVHGVPKSWTWLSDFHFTSPLDSRLLSQRWDQLRLWELSGWNK